MFSQKRDLKPEATKAILAILALQVELEVAIDPEKLQENYLNCHLMIIILLLQKICLKQMKLLKINK